MTTKTTTPSAADLRDSRLTEVLDLATSTARGEIDGAENKKVTAKATLSVSATEGTKTTDDGVEAGVTLGVSHSETDSAAAKK